MGEYNFFQEQEEQSLVKAKIVSKYFWAWARVILPTVKRRPDGKIAYIDLFAGPGRYKDGAMSTPLLVLEKAIEDKDLRTTLLTLFNDKDDAHARSLEEAINSLPGINTLRYKPKVYNQEIGTKIVRQFEQNMFIPTLFFVDPWGYKGLSLRLVDAVLKDWGCDCIFFFNYNRINMGLGNELVEEHINALFGEKRADLLRARLAGMSPSDRELTIIEALSDALQSHDQRYVLPFAFRTTTGKRTDHHLIFVSKNFRGYEIMKDIMARESSTSNQGVPTFEYDPALTHQGLLFELSRPIDQLADTLMEEYAGRTLRMDTIYREHNVGRAYIKKNYKRVLLNLESDGAIITNPSKRYKNTIADHVLVAFPPDSDTSDN